MNINPRRRFKGLGSKLSELVSTALNHTHNHFSCYLPKNIGFLPSYALKLFFSGIHLAPEQSAVLQSLPRDAVIVYVAKYNSRFEYLFYHTRYKELGLPAPEIGMDYKVFIWQPLSRIFRIFLAQLDYFVHHFKFADPYAGGYIKAELTKGRCGMLSLIEHKMFYRRFLKSHADPVQHLIELQRAIDRPIYLVPQLMFFSKTPARSIPSIIDMLFGTKERPGRIRRLVTLFRNPGKVFVEISQPVSLKAYLENSANRPQNPELQAVALRRSLLDGLNRHRQSIIGPTLTTRQELKESILTGHRLRSFMEGYSQRREIPMHKVHKEADGYLEEIAANYSSGFVKIATAIVRWLVKTLFEGVTVNQDMLNRVKSMAQKGPLIFVPCHKSHFDYLILPYVLYTNNMPPPHVVAGKNLFFWPVAPLLRAGGAFSTRRTFRGAAFYSKVYAEYVHKLLREGFNIKLFIEGGRSRTGKMILPKLGFLSIMLNAYREGACEDLIFAPIYIGYDRVLEEKSYLHEIEGGQKKPENIWQIIRARKLLKKRYGKIYIKFQEPISLKQRLARENTAIDRMSPKEQNALCRNLGHRMINAINQATVLTPHGLVASAVLNASKESFSHENLLNEIETYITHLFSQKVSMADTLLFDHVRAAENAIEAYVQRKFIERKSGKKEHPSSDLSYRVIESKRPNLEYYKNNCVGFFIPAAFTSLAILDKDAFQFSATDLHAGYTFFQEFFKNEFAYDVDKAPDFFVRKIVKAFIDDAILMPHPSLPDTYNLTSAGFRKLKLFSGFLKTYFEAYWVVLNFLMRRPNKKTDAKDRLKKIQARGNRMWKRKEIERKEALSKIYYLNGLNYFNAHGLKSSEDVEQIAHYREAIQRYLKHVSS